MRDVEKRIRLVGKLLRLTRAGELEWTSVEAPKHDFGEGRFVSQTYATSVGGLIFRLYRVEFLGKDLVLSPQLSDAVRRFKPVYTVLEYSDEDSELGEYETVVSADDIFVLNSLYDEVRKSSSETEKKIDAFLKSEPPHAERHHG